MKTALLILLLALGACTTTGAKLVCLPMVTYTKEQGTALANQSAALPQGSPVALALQDYGKLRAADRACAATTK